MPFAEPPQPFFDPAQATFEGILMLILGALFLVRTFKGDTQPMSQAWLWITTAAGFALATLLMIEGSVMLLTGQGSF
jgi:hypothetical protein